MEVKRYSQPDCKSRRYVSPWWFQLCKVIFRAHRDIHKSYRAVPKLFHLSNLVNQASYMFIRLTEFRRRSCTLLHGIAMDGWLHPLWGRWYYLVSSWKFLKNQWFALLVSVVCSQVGLRGWKVNAAEHLRGAGPLNRRSIVKTLQCHTDNAENIATRKHGTVDLQRTLPKRKSAAAIVGRFRKKIIIKNTVLLVEIAAGVE